MASLLNNKLTGTAHFQSEYVTTEEPHHTYLRSKCAQHDATGPAYERHFEVD
jgi:hypothetical protein